MPQIVREFAMVPSPNGKGVIILGRDYDDDEDEDENQMVIMELNGDTLEWKILDQTLDVHRYEISAIPIGYEFDLEMFSENYSAEK